MILKAGVVLCGGQSRRMGRPKALLPFGPETLLQRVVRLLGSAVEHLVVVAAVDQHLPELPGAVQVARDEISGRGPLQGMQAGLAALPVGWNAAYVTGCDFPLLQPAFVQRMFELAVGWDIAVPYVDGFHHPLAAVYRPPVQAAVADLLAKGRLRPYFLFQAVPTRIVTAAELSDVDPHGLALKNLNEPANYLAALQIAGLPAPPEYVRLPEIPEQT